jgi:bifunctional lysine-specific demethylase and histidyl-hydroxylase MINA
VRASQELLGCLVGSNSYLTPPHAQGLPPHHDDVDVWVMQLEGTKQWRLHAPPLSLPRDHSGVRSPSTSFVVR